MGIERFCSGTIFLSVDDITGFNSVEQTICIFVLSMRFLFQSWRKSDGIKRYNRQANKKKKKRERREREEEGKKRKKGEEAV